MYSYNIAGGVVAKRLRLSQMQNWYWDYNPNPGTMNIDLDASFGYDNEGRMTSEQYLLSGPNMTLTYDSMGRPYSAVGGDGIASASYGAAGQLLSTTGTGYGPLPVTYSYNSMLQLTGISGGGKNIQYNYAATQNNGKIVSETDVVSGEQVNYTYDALNRLATAMTSDNPNVAQWGQSFTYDGFGNLTNVNVIKGSAPALGVSYDPATNHGACTDANGNTVFEGCGERERLCGPTLLYGHGRQVLYAGPLGHERGGHAESHQLEHVRLR